MATKKIISTSWGENSLIPNSKFDSYLPQPYKNVDSNNLQVLLKTLQSGVNSIYYNISQQEDGGIVSKNGIPYSVLTISNIGESDSGVILTRDELFYEINDYLSSGDLPTPDNLLEKETTTDDGILTTSISHTPTGTIELEVINNSLNTNNLLTIKDNDISWEQYDASGTPIIPVPKNDFSLINKKYFTDNVGSTAFASGESVSSMIINQGTITDNHLPTEELMIEVITKKIQEEISLGSQGVNIAAATIRSWDEEQNVKIFKDILNVSDKIEGQYQQNSYSAKDYQTVISYDFDIFIPNEIKNNYDGISYLDGVWTFSTKTKITIKITTTATGYDSSQYLSFGYYLNGVPNYLPTIGIGDILIPQGESTIQQNFLPLTLEIGDSISIFAIRNVINSSEIVKSPIDLSNINFYFTFNGLSISQPKNAAVSSLIYDDRNNETTGSVLLDETFNSLDLRLDVNSQDLKKEKNNREISDGDLSQLLTIDKSSLVAAINEIFTSGGSGTAVEGYLLLDLPDQSITWDATYHLDGSYDGTYSIEIGDFDSPMKLSLFSKLKIITKVKGVMNKDGITQDIGELIQTLNVDFSADSSISIDQNLFSWADGIKGGKFLGINLSILAAVGSRTSPSFFSLRVNNPTSANKVDASIYFSVIFSTKIIGVI